MTDLSPEASASYTLILAQCNAAQLCVDGTLTGSVRKITVKKKVQKPNHFTQNDDNNKRCK